MGGQIEGERHKREWGGRGEDEAWIWWDADYDKHITTLQINCCRERERESKGRLIFALMKLQQWPSVLLRGRGLVMTELGFLFLNWRTNGWTDGWMDSFHLVTLLFFSAPFKPFLHLQSLFFLVSWSELLLSGCPCLCIWLKGGELDNLRSWVIRKKSTIYFTSEEWRLKYTLH